MTALARTQPRITADEFWAFDRGGQIGNIELVHGHLRMQSYPSGGHGVIQLNLGLASKSI